MRSFCSARDARADDLGRIEGQLELYVGHPAEVVSRQHRGCCTLHESDLARDRDRSVRWSPVDHHDLDAGVTAPTHGSGTSGRGGSSKPTRAGHHQVLLGIRPPVPRRENSIREGQGPESRDRPCPSPPCRTRSRSSGAQRHLPPSTSIQAACGNTSSGAPFDERTTSSATRWTSTNRLRSGSKGISSMRSNSGASPSAVDGHPGQCQLHGVAEPPL